MPARPGPMPAWLTKPNHDCSTEEAFGALAERIEATTSTPTVLSKLQKWYVEQSASSCEAASQNHIAAIIKDVSAMAQTTSS